MRSLVAIPMLALATATLADEELCDADVARGSPVDEVYPTSSKLPSNLLRFYIYFSGPMRREGVAGHVTLVDESGNVVTDALLPTRYELWSPDATRLTVLLDPGRIKSGLASSADRGRALETGRRYGLVVDQHALDVRGCASTSNYTKWFEVGPPDLTPPTPSAWTLTLPRAGTRDALLVSLQGAHDHLSMAYRIKILKGDGMAVPGSVSLGESESQWLFQPRRAWSRQPYEIVVDAALEDLAGNRPSRLFDLPLDAKRTSSQSEDASHLSFTPTE